MSGMWYAFRQRAKMKVSVILGHPRQGSFNHAIARAAADTLSERGCEVLFHDLCKEGFDPLLTAGELERDALLPEGIRAHCDEIAGVDGIIIVHPNWWGQPPAIVKGWVDRILRPGVAYEFVEGDEGEGVPRGLLKAKRVVIFNTSNTPGTREKEAFGDPLELLWKNCIFDLCGVEGFYRRMFNVVVVSTDGERNAWLDEVRGTVAGFFP